MYSHNGMGCEEKVSKKIELHLLKLFALFQAAIEILRSNFQSPIGISDELFKYSKNPYIRTKKIRILWPEFSVLHHLNKNLL